MPDFDASKNMLGLQHALSPVRGQLQTAARKLPDWVFTAAVIIAIGMLVIAGLYAPYDTSTLVSGDALYPIAMLDAGIFDFRPPPPNRLFPDIGVHWLVSLSSLGMLDQKVVAGLLLFSSTLIAVGLFKSWRVFAAVAIVMLSFGFGFVESASHYTLPLLVLVYQLAPRNSLLSLILLALMVFFDILVLIPLMILLTDPKARSRDAANAIAALTGFMAACIYADFGVSFVQLALVIPLWGATLLIAQRLDIKSEWCAAVTIVLLVGAIIGIWPPRYAVPIGASILVALTPVERLNFSWFTLAVPAVVSAVFLATADFKSGQRIAQSYACLAKALSDLGITNVATDHWSAKPLYISANELGVPLTLTQTDFGENKSHLWMAPYSFYGAPTQYAVRSNISCAIAQNDPRYCGQKDVAAVIDYKPLCGDFGLWHYSEPVPANFYGPRRSKLGETARQLQLYTERAINKIPGLGQ